MCSSFGDLADTTRGAWRGGSFLLSVLAHCKSRRRGSASPCKQQLWHLHCRVFIRRPIAVCFKHLHQPEESVQGTTQIQPPLNRTHSRTRMRGCKESGHQMEDFHFLSFPCSSIFHTHNKSTFTPSTLQLPPTLLMHFLIFFFFPPTFPPPSPLPSLLPSLSFSPPPHPTPPNILSPCSCVIRFSFVHSSFNPCCYSSRPPSFVLSGGLWQW